MAEIAGNRKEFIYRRDQFHMFLRRPETMAKVSEIKNNLVAFYRTQDAITKSRLTQSIDELLSMSQNDGVFYETTTLLSSLESEFLMRGLK